MHCGLYIHTPFCETKCGYCDFYSVALKGRNTAPLVDAICRELEVRLETRACPIRTIFVGGGTPTLLPIDDLARLLARVRKLVPLDAIEEFTVEANPATIDDAKAALLADSGVNRVSMGAQSFVPAELAALERLHSPDDIAPSVAVLRRHGIAQLNLDLIFGIPGQTCDTWSQSIGRAMELGPDHIACYGLTYEPHTRLTAQRDAGRVAVCDEDVEADMYLLAVDTLESAGYRQYEISNYARPGRESRHNLIYWRNEPYIGIGPSAAGCLPEPRASAGATKQSATPLQATGSLAALSETALQSPPPETHMRRYKNVPDISRYARMIGDTGCAEIESEFIEGDTLIHELILMQLRLNEGLSIAAFRERTGLDPLTTFGDTLDRLVRQELVTVSSTHIALTPTGRLVANRVMTDLAAAVGRGDPRPSRLAVLAG